MGVSHVKIKKWEEDLLKRRPDLSFTLRQYHSRLYAFEPIPPYRIVARSGQFCMSGIDGTTKDATRINDYNNNPNSNLIQAIPVSFGNTNLSCPHITFITGIIEAIDNPQKLIISYGMNDCVPRIVKVDRREMIRMLFPNHYGSY